MMTSLGEAMAGNRFWFAAGPAFVGLMIHMVTGAAYGMVFAVVARRLHRNALVPVGMVFCLGTFFVSSFVGLRIAATITGAGYDNLGHGEDGRMVDLRARAPDVRARTWCPGPRQFSRHPQG